MDYYTIHDETNNRIGFVPHNASNKLPLEKGKQPDRTFLSSQDEPQPISFWAWIWGFAIIIAFASCWVLAIFNLPEG